MIFSPTFALRLPDTYALLQRANLIVHPNVARVVLHGSRGLAGNARPDSDIDLSLIVDLPIGFDAMELEPLLHSVFEITFSAWRAEIEPDLAVVFETRACSLHCFTQSFLHEDLCDLCGLDFFGLYKVQKGFTGLVTNAGVEIRRMLPCLEICRRAAAC
jgi:predicted nucleotidyltransferase